MSRTYDLADKLIYYVLAYLVKKGPTPIATLVADIEVEMKFTEWESVVYKKTGVPRWERMLFSFSIDLTKAEWITKKRKIWELTAKGKKALEKLKTPTKLRIEAKRLFDIWNAIPHDELKRRKAAARAAREKALRNKKRKASDKKASKANEKVSKAKRASSRA